MNKIIWGTGLLLLLLSGIWLLQRGYLLKPHDIQVEPVADVERVTPEPAPIPKSVPVEVPVKQEEPKVKRDPFKTPFIVQAPNSEWDNPLFENACEEASLLMVASLFRGNTTISPADTREELLALAGYQKKQFGHSVDTSVADTQMLLTEYFDIRDSKVIEAKNAEELISLLSEDTILIVPADGQKLGNPFFTPPGPINHMLVILRYDAKTQEFITHDPGTKRGALYRYQADILWSAIRDYPTGATHLPNNKKEKRMIAVPLEQ